VVLQASQHIREFMLDKKIMNINYVVSLLPIHQNLCSQESAEKPYKCKDYSNCFDYPSGLLVHQRIYTGKKPYKCKDCYKSFNQCSLPRNHQRVHTEEKLYQYKDCDKSFSDNSTFRNHQRIHTGEKAYKCKD
jgi:uncharacterized Zn-finger protein